MKLASQDALPGDIEKIFLNCNLFVREGFFFEIKGLK